MRDRRMRAHHEGALSRVVAGAAALLCVLALGAAPAGAAESKAKSPETRLVGVVNVNTATLDELQLLPGVGPVRAAAIVEHRRKHGAFKGADDLVQVSGIGERALARIRDHVTTQGKTTAKLEH